jgi:glucose-1-phosphate thymidylyltransferase
MKAIIPVAGVGTRMRPHTYSLPKVLLNVAGKPILGHIIDALRDFGIDDIVIITGYKGELVEEFVLKNYPELKFEFCKQDEMLGLGHAILQAKDTFNEEPVLIILGDTIFDIDLKAAISSEHNVLAVKAVEDPSRFGVVLVNQKGVIQKLVEKPKEIISNLAIVGIYSIKNSLLLAECLQYLVDNDVKTRGEYQLTDALQLMINKDEVFEICYVDGWFDCGKPETLLSTNEYLLERNHVPIELEDSIVIPPVFISDSAVITNSIIGPYATISDGAIITNSIIKDSIISFNAVVKNSLLRKSIIGSDAEVKGTFSKLNVGDSSQIINK